VRARVSTPRVASTTIAAGDACAARVVRAAPQISDSKTRSPLFVFVRAFACFSKTDASSARILMNKTYKRRNTRSRDQVIFSGEFQTREGANKCHCEI
jgi:hypothetical protein